MYEKNIHLYKENDMKTIAIKAVSSTKNFVNNHKTAIAVITTAAVCLKINRLALAEHDQFLKDHDLYDEYYMPTDEEIGA